MEIYKILQNKLQFLKSETFKDEATLQKLVDNNLKLLFGLEFIRNEFGGQGLSIDTIAYDPENKAPVLIEYKRDEHISVIDQGFAYLYWLLNHKGDYLLRLQEKLGKKDVDWSQARVIFVAKRYHIHQISALGFKGVPFELWRYDLSGDIFQLEQIETPKSDVSITNILKSKPAKEVAATVKEFTVEDRIGKSKDNIKAIFSTISEQIKKFGDGIQEKVFQTYIAYRVRYFNFCRLWVFTDSIDIYITLPKIEDPKKIFKKVPPNWGWARNTWYCKIRQDDKLSYIINVIKKAYDTAPDK
jgi:predicted transport protein